jgi:hypothetical protein
MYIEGYHEQNTNLLLDEIYLFDNKAFIFSRTIRPGMLPPRQSHDMGTPANVAVLKNIL